MEEGDWDGIWVLREEGREVDVEVEAVVVLDSGFEGGEGIDVSFFFAPRNIVSITRISLMNGDALQ